MTSETIAFQDLNAYVDGELDASTSARVAEAAAADPEVAASIAKLQRMKATLGEAFENVHVINVHTRPRWHQAGWLVAASLAAAIVIGGIWLVNSPLLPGGVGQPAPAGAVVSAMLRAHDQWLGDGTARQLRAIPVAGLRPPNLTPAGLSIASYQSPVDMGGTMATQISYIGKRGCRLSLFIAPATPELAKMARLTGEQEPLVEAWQANQAQYLLVSRLMHQTRFATIAAALKAATTNGGLYGDRFSMALATARQPCNDKAPA
ncbi:MAG: hypothetical protein ACC634_04915 [Hyphomicrobiales bacterium]